MERKRGRIEAGIGGKGTGSRRRTLYAEMKRKRVKRTICEK
jgi:hypothetical protein